MSNPIEFARAILVTCGLAGAVVAQNRVWIVDAGGGAGAHFAEIQPAVDVATDGDVVLVRGGDYASFVIDRLSLTIVADAGAAVRISKLTEPSVFGAAPIEVEVRNLGAEQNVLLRGIEIRPPRDEPLNLGPSFSPAPAALKLLSNAGPIWIEDCRIRGSVYYPNPLLQFNAGDGALVDSCASVIWIDCRLGGQLSGGDSYGNTASDAGHALVVRESSVALYGCAVDGGITPGPWGADSFSCYAATPPRHGLRALSSFVHASGCSFHGADGGDGSNGGIASQGKTNGASGGHGLDLPAPGSHVVLLDSSSHGGEPGVGGTFSLCPDGRPGMSANDPFGGVTQLSGVARGLSVQSPLRELQAGRISYSGAPSDLVLALISNVAPSANLLPIGVLQLATPFALAQSGIAGGGGTVSLPFTAPLLAPGFQALDVYFQPLVIASSGEVRLGGPSSLVILDRSL